MNWSLNRKSIVTAFFDEVLLDESCFDCMQESEYQKLPRRDSASRNSSWLDTLNEH